MNLTHHTETVPTPDPTTAAQIDAAHRELRECRELLRTPSELLLSPRMRRRYNEAVQAVQNINSKEATK